MKKAFNSIFRQGLWYKLNMLGMNGKLLRVIKCMYSKIKCCIRGRKGITDCFITLLGVQQGAMLSPYLFAFFLNDLPDLLKTHNAPGGISIDETDIMMLMYADDIVLVSKSIVGLQNSLDLLYDYCNMWKLTVNFEKSNILVCRSGGRKHINEIWFWGDHIMEQCDNYKYLGITFSAGGITNTALTVLNDQAKKAMLSLLSGMNNIGIFPPAAALGHIK